MAAIPRVKSFLATECVAIKPSTVVIIVDLLMDINNC